MSDAQEKTAVTVRIGGEDHTLRANVEPEYTKQCAKWVDDRIGEIRNQLGLIESHKAAILAALSITDEMFQARRELEELRLGTAGKVSELAERLEVALAEDARELELDLLDGDDD